MTYEEAKAKLDGCGQSHLLAFWPQLGEEERARLLEAVEGLDVSFAEHFLKREEGGTEKHIEPLPVFLLSDIENEENALRRKGAALLEEGRAAAVLMAGGMGSRLGSDGPKGAFDIGITHPVYIFERLIDNLMESAAACARKPLLLIMTSGLNDAATRSFLKGHGYFGYPEDRIRFFVQSAAPAVDGNGKLLLASPSEIVSAPNGNGGWFRSIADAGLLPLLHEEGVTYLNVFGVDNVLQRICDPLFLGAVAGGGYEAGCKVVCKTDPEEKVGVICRADGHPGVVEYIELSEEMRYRKDPDGNYTYRFGVIGNYLFRLDRLKEACGEALPLHFAHKKVPCIPPENAEKGIPDIVVPEEPNAWKFEYFIFDILKSFDRCLPFEVRRSREFAPVKNRTGTDSVESARALCLENGINL